MAASGHRTAQEPGLKFTMCEGAFWADLQVGSPYRRFAEPAGQMQGGKWVPASNKAGLTLRFENSGGKPPGPYCRDLDEAPTEGEVHPQQSPIAPMWSLKCFNQTVVWARALDEVLKALLLCRMSKPWQFRSPSTPDAHMLLMQPGWTPTLRRPAIIRPASSVAVVAHRRDWSNMQSH
jgi:hypothetical protein